MCLNPSSMSETLWRVIYPPGVLILRQVPPKHTVGEELRNLEKDSIKSNSPRASISEMSIILLPPKVFSPVIYFFGYLFSNSHLKHIRISTSRYMRARGDPRNALTCLGSSLQQPELPPHPPLPLPRPSPILLLRACCTPRFQAPLHQLSMQWHCPPRPGYLY
jgi:hypothetical protein